MPASSIVVMDSSASYQRPLPPGWVAEFSDDHGRLKFIDTMQIPPHVTFEDPRENDALYPTSPKSNTARRVFSVTSAAPAHDNIPAVTTANGPANIDQGSSIGIITGEENTLPAATATRPNAVNKTIIPPTSTPSRYNNNTLDFIRDSVVRLSTAPTSNYDPKHNLSMKDLAQISQANDQSNTSQNTRPGQWQRVAADSSSAVSQPHSLVNHLSALGGSGFLLSSVSTSAASCDNKQQQKHS